MSVWDIIYCFNFSRVPRDPYFNHRKGHSARAHVKGAARREVPKVKSLELLVTSEID